jgi:hypothetical protein
MITGSTDKMSVVHEARYTAIEARLTEEINGVETAVTEVRAGYVRIAQIDGTLGETIIDGGAIKANTLSASKITTGRLQSASGQAWFDLDLPEIGMNGTDGKIRISPSNPLRVLDASNKVIAGLTKKGTETLFFSNALANKENPDVWFVAGEELLGSELYHGIFAHSKTNPNDSFFRITTHKSDTLSRSDTTNWISSNVLSRIVQHAQSDENGEISYVRLNAHINGHFGVLRIAHDMFDVYFDSMANAKISADNSGAMLAHGNHELGVDSSGPYRIKNGTKTYF